jgi:hypothetical protein
MSWYRCSCGFLSEATPRLTRSIASVSHLRRGAQLNGTSSINMLLDRFLEASGAPAPPQVPDTRENGTNR